MIWFFIAGWIAGAVAVVLILIWWARTHMKPVTLEEMLNELDEAGHPDGNGTGDREGRDVSEPEGDADGEDRMGSAPVERVADEEPGKSQTDG